MRFFSSFVAWLRRTELARSQSLACSQASRHAVICSAKRPRCRQYSDRSAAFMAAVSITAANLSRELQPSGPASASGSNWPLSRAFFRQLCKVASDIPSSCDSRRNGTLFGGSIFFRTAALRSAE